MGLKYLYKGQIYDMTPYENPQQGSARLHIKNGTVTEKYGFTSDVSASQYCPLAYRIGSVVARLGKTQSTSSSTQENLTRSSQYNTTRQSNWNNATRSSEYTTTRSSTWTSSTTNYTYTNTYNRTTSQQTTSTTTNYTYTGPYNSTVTGYDYEMSRTSQTSIMSFTYYKWHTNQNAFGQVGAGSTWGTYSRTWTERRHTSLGTISSQSISSIGTSKTSYINNEIYHISTTYSQTWNQSIALLARTISSQSIKATTIQYSPWYSSKSLTYTTTKQTNVQSTSTYSPWYSSKSTTGTTTRQSNYTTSRQSNYTTTRQSNYTTSRQSAYTSSKSTSTSSHNYNL